MRYPIALIALALAGCNTTPPVPELPKTVEVMVKQYVPLPSELTKDCQTFVAREQSYDEAKRLAILRGEAADECNKRWAKVRALQSKEKP